MTDTRHKDTRWVIKDNYGYPGAQLAVLMDIRDELQTLNALLRCDNFIRIPLTLRQIRDEIKRTNGPLCRCGRVFQTRKGRDQHTRIAERRRLPGHHGAVANR